MRCVGCKAACTARKRRALSYGSFPDIGHRSKCQRSTSTFSPRLLSPSLSPTLDRAQSSNAHLQADIAWTESAKSIIAWIEEVPVSCTYNETWSSSPSDDAQLLDTMSDSSRLRDLKTQRCSRSCSPTKKSPQYRNTVLKPANILVDVVHDLPPDIEALLPRGLRDIFDPTRPAPPFTIDTHAADVDGDNGSKDRARRLADEVNRIAAVYRDECRELARKTGSEPEYRTHLYGDVVEKLARIQPWRGALSANCSDKLWLVSLKPPDPSPILSLPWPPLSANSVATKPQERIFAEPVHDSSDSNIIRLRPGSSTFNLTSPPVPIEPSDLSSTGDLDSTITTPKPDITVGISREAFSRIHAGLLDHWQARKVVLSDPHATQGDMRFPFFIIEAKGLTTNGNLIGAQNQAAGGGACAMRLLASLAAQDPENNAPRIVFSCTTEGAIHELWVHFQTTDEGDIPKQHMSCLGVWRTTLDRHANEFVAVLAIILSWGADVFFPQIKQVLDRALSGVISAG